MRKKSIAGSVIWTILLVVFSLLLILCVVVIVVIKLNYKNNNAIYSDVEEQVLESSEISVAEQIKGITVTGTVIEIDEAGEETEVEKELIYAPIQVDFDKLLELNPDTIGWVYCPDTCLNYPLVWHGDNSYYVNHAFDGTETKIGALFEDGGNNRGFIDGNMIIYGHNMNDGAMFATLSDWADQTYYENHPIMWILTPEGDFKLELFSGYISNATDWNAFRLYNQGDPTLLNYVQGRKDLSDFKSDVELDPEARYITFSTCNYTFDMGRYVMHGKLVPVDSVGGK